MLRPTVGTRPAKQCAGTMICGAHRGQGAIITTVVHSIVRSLAADGPMLPTLVDGLPDRAGWVFEPKWDGWRCLAIVDGGRVDIRSRRAVDLGPYFPELVQTLHPLAGRRVVLDGEIVVLRHGRPDFDAISGRLAARRLSDWAASTTPATFVAFDLLELDGRTLVDVPYTARREALGGTGHDGRPRPPPGTVRPSGRRPTNSASRASCARTPGRRGCRGGAGGGSSASTGGTGRSGSWGGRPRPAGIRRAWSSVRPEPSASSASPVSPPSTSIAMRGRP